MAPLRRKYCLDTNLFIRGYRDPDANQELQAFHYAFAPFEYLSVIVMHELAAGATTPAALRNLHRHLIEPFQRRGRVFEPTTRTWERAARVLRDLREREGLELRRVPRSFGHDILLACSCRELGITLVTDNARDFECIATVFKFRWRLPWPPTR